MSRISTYTSIRNGMLAGAAMVALAVSPALSQTPTLVEFDIDAQELGGALTEFGIQSRTEVLFSGSELRGVQTGGVEGTFSADRAIGILLDDTGIDYRRNDDGTLLVGKASVQTASLQSKRPSLGEESASEPFRVAQLDQEESVQELADPETVEDGLIDEVVVTGTNIRGVNDQFSPVISLDNEDFDKAAQITLSDVFQGLPQNFNGGVALATGQGSSADGVGSVGINLRGLGNEATLVLLNGRRLAGSGLAGGFVDVSSIPTSALERVEVLTDGASAIYGSDAIAGVVNIIVRDDFDGAESRLSIGSLDDGSANSLRAAQTVGVSRDRGNAVLTYEYSTQDELSASDRGFAAGLPETTDILPFSQKHSLFASGDLNFTERLEVSVDAFFNTRKSKLRAGTQAFAFQEQFSETNIDQFGGGLGLTYDLPNDWQASLDATYSENDFVSEVLFIDQIPAGQGSTFEADTSILSVNGAVDGPLFSIASEPVRLVIGGGYRKEKLDQLSTSLPSGFEIINETTDRDVAAVYAEVYAPIVTPDMSKPGIHRLAITAAVRHEDFSDVGSSTDPKFGLAWSPVETLNLRGTYSTAFRAPRLDQILPGETTVFLNNAVDPSSPTGESAALELFASGNPDLRPEEAETLTIGFDYTPQFLDGFTLKSTFFSIEYDDRVSSPTLAFDDQFRYTGFPGVPILNPSLAEVQSLIDSASTVLNFSDFFPIAPITAEDVSIIFDTRPQNISKSSVEGFDVSFDYQRSLGSGVLLLTTSATILTTFDEQFSLTTPENDLLNTFGNPVDLRLRSGMSWSNEKLSVNAFINYVSDYVDDQASTGPVDVDSFTTVDATSSLFLGELFEDGIFSDTTLTFGIANILDENPPEIGSRVFGSPVYDPSNSNPSGRSFSLQLVKKW